MILLVYSETNADTISRNAGRSEYSYHFVLQSFRPLLAQLGVVIEVSDPSRQVDAIWANARHHGEDCRFLSFSPPHRTSVDLECPTIPVFAWEFDTIPHEIWDDEPRHDWTSVLKSLGQAIVHSSDTVAAVRRALGSSVEVVSVPAPVWDRYASFREKGSVPSPCGSRSTLILKGPCIDSRTFQMEGFDHSFPSEKRLARAADVFAAQTRPNVIRLCGVVYTAVLNPFDARKRLWDMIVHFVWAFRNRPDATLLLKTTHADTLLVMTALLGDLLRSQPFLCRVVVVHGLLSEESYRAIVQATTYVVNCSAGEGQCMPLMEFMSCGRPAIAPQNTAMADYVTEKNSFLVASHPEPTSWPQDTREMLRTMRHRIDFHSLMLAFQESFIVARCDPGRYRAMSDDAIGSLRRHCSDEVLLDRLRLALRKPESDATASRVIGREEERIAALV